jgi:hypothetical protein
MKAMNKTRPSLKKYAPWKLRTTPNQKDIAYIKHQFGYIPFHIMAVELNVKPETLSKWAKLAFTPNDKANEYKRIEANLLEMELQQSIEAELMNEYDVATVRRSFNNITYIRKHRVYTLNRMFYLVTIDHSFNYLVKFDVAVDMNSVEYCPASVGCDYEVKPVGYWEWMHLRDSLPVVEIIANEDYIGSFWLALDQMRIQYFT